MELPLWAESVWTSGDGERKGFGGKLTESRKSFLCDSGGVGTGFIWKDCKKSRKVGKKGDRTILEGLLDL
jgi:hypothetical protein